MLKENAQCVPCTQQYINDDMVKYDGVSQLHPSCLRGTVRIFGHCHYGDNEEDNGGSHTSHEILKRVPIW